MARLAGGSLVLGLGGRVPLAGGGVLCPAGHFPLQAGWHGHGQPRGDGWPHAGRLAPHKLQIRVGHRAGPGLSRMKPSALGLDGWSVADLRSLPDRQLGWLADLLREVERLGKWPARLAEGYIAFIPDRSRSCPWTTGCGRVCAGGRNCVARVLGPPGGPWVPPGQNLSSAVPELWFCSSGGVCVRMRVCSEPLYL